VTASTHVMLVLPTSRRKVVVTVTASLDQYGGIMTDSKELHCPKCGGEKFENRDDLIVCMVCGHTMRFEDLQLLALIDALIEEAQAVRH
jgi:uncharacterized Zn finger protein (UPF0148 family)